MNEGEDQTRDLDPVTGTLYSLRDMMRFSAHVMNEATIENRTSLAVSMECARFRDELLEILNKDKP